jgi:hypothetical protein
MKADDGFRNGGEFPVDNLLAHAKNWQPLIAIITVIGGVIWYFAGLESQVKLLELQVHTLAVAPTIAQAGAPQSGQPSTEQEPQVVSNPIAAACGKLADTLAAQVEKGYASSYIGNTREALKTLVCVPPAQ